MKTEQETETEVKWSDRPQSRAGYNDRGPHYALPKGIADEMKEACDKWLDDHNVPADQEFNTFYPKKRGHE